MKIYVALAIVSGVAAGLVSSLVAGRITRRDQEVPTGMLRTTDTNRSTLPATKEQELEARLRRVEALEQATRAAITTAAASASVAPLPPSPPAPFSGSSRAELETDFARKVSDHYLEPDEPTWATAAQKSVDSDLAQLLHGPDAPARAVKVSCRTTTCAVELEWPTFAKAIESWSPLLNHNYALGCARTIMLPDPTPGTAADAPYRTTLLLDCEEARARAVSEGR